MTFLLRHPAVLSLGAAAVLAAAGIAGAESVAFKSPGPGMHVTAGLPVVVYGDLLPREDSFPGWPKAECLWDGRLVGQMDGGTKVFNYFPFVVPTEQVTPGIHILRLNASFHTGARREASLAVQVDPWPAARKPVELKEDLAVQDLDWAGVAVRGNGHTVKVTGKLTIKDSLITGLGSLTNIADAEKAVMTVGLTAALTGDVTIEGSVFESTGALRLQIDGPGAVSFRDNEFRASNFIKFVPSNPDASPVIEIWGANATKKLFQGNRIASGRLVFRGMKNWLIGSGEDCRELDGNILMGPRCTINVENGSDVTVRGNYSYHNYRGEWSQGYNFVFGHSSSGILTEHNLIRAGSWPVQDLGGEFRYNVVLGYGHTWIRTVQSDARIHHNVFTPEGGGGLSFGIECYHNYTYAAAKNITIYNNTFDGGALAGDFAGGFVGAVNPTVEIASLRNNLFTYARDQQNSRPGQPLVGGKEGKYLYADYNAFYSPDSTQKSNYGITIDGKEQGQGGFAGHDVGGRGTVGEVNGRLAAHPFAGKRLYPYTIDEAAVWSRMMKLSQVLAQFRAAYTPVEGSGLIDKGDPADGDGVDIGAIEAPGGKPRPEDRFGRYAAPSKDTEPPKVELTGKIGPTLAGETTVTAAASDNVGVAGVQILVDGVPFGDASAAPFAVRFNSAVMPDGEHTIVARAWDAAGNSAESAPVKVVVGSAAAPAAAPKP